MLTGAPLLTTLMCHGHSGGHHSVHPANVAYTYHAMLRFRGDGHDSQVSFLNLTQGERQSIVEAQGYSSLFNPAGSELDWANLNEVPCTQSALAQLASETQGTTASNNTNLNHTSSRMPCEWAARVLADAGCESAPIEALAEVPVQSRDCASALLCPDTLVVCDPAEKSRVNPREYNGKTQASDSGSIYFGVFLVFGLILCLKGESSQRTGRPKNNLY